MNFLDHYLNYSAVNESPYVYHKWCGLSLLSHLIGRRIWTDEQMFIVRPNMYVNLVGPPGLAKSTASNVAKNFIKDHHKNIFVAPASITKESIVQTMAREDGGCIISYHYDDKPQRFSQLSIFANEMVSLLSAGNNIIGMIDFLTDIWDSNEYREKTKNKGDNTIVNPFVNILGNFTTDTVKALMHSKIITGGMSRRCIFVYSDGAGIKPVARIRYTQDQLHSLHELISMSKEIVKLAGPFTWTPEADEFYLTWYDSNYYRIEKCSSDVLKNFLRSKAEYCIKVSMLLSIAEPKPRLVHTLNGFKRAVDLVTEVENGASILFDSSGRNELALIGTEVERYLASVQTAGLQQIYTRFWSQLKDGDTTEIDRIVDQLIREGKVKTGTEMIGYQSIKKVTWNVPSSSTEASPSPLTDQASA